MKKLITVLLLLSATCPVVWGDETQKLLQAVGEKAAGSIVIISWITQDEISSQAHVGVGVCIDKRGWFMTPSISTQSRAETIRDMKIILPGSGHKSVKAKLLGIDPITGMSFVQAGQQRSWNPIAFVKNSELKPGSPVVSFGINPLDSLLSPVVLESIGIRY